MWILKLQMLGEKASGCVEESVQQLNLKPRWPMQRQPPTRVTFECVCLPKMTKREGEKIRMLHTFRLLCRM